MWAIGLVTSKITIAIHTIWGDFFIFDKARFTKFSSFLLMHDQVLKLSCVTIFYSFLLSISHTRWQDFLW
jgi:hypothetical protein